MVGELLVDIIKTGTLTLVISKVSKAIGQKDIAEIISGIGLIVIGTDLVQIIKPVAEFILDVTKITSDTLKLLNEWGLKVDKFLNPFGG